MAEVEPPAPHAQGYMDWYAHKNSPPEHYTPEQQAEWRKGRRAGLRERSKS